MGNIRSTIDIIMERTRGMTLSAEEQQSLHIDELRKRAKGFRLKLLTDVSAAEQVVSALKDEPPEDRKRLESFIWEEMVRELPADKEILHHLEAMAFLPQAKNKAPALTELRAAFKSGFKGAAEDRKKIVSREKKKLAALGISGSAVVPKIPKDAGGGSAAQELIEKYRPRLLEGISV